MRNAFVTQRRQVANITCGDMLPLRAADLHSCAHSLGMVAQQRYQNPDEGHRFAVNESLHVQLTTCWQRSHDDEVGQP
jgi:hypothetical protein